MLRVWCCFIIIINVVVILLLIAYWEIRRFTPLNWLLGVCSRHYGLLHPFETSWWISNVFILHKDFGNLKVHEYWSTVPNFCIHRLNPFASASCLVKAYLNNSMVIWKTGVSWSIIYLFTKYLYYLFVSSWMKRKHPHWSYYPLKSYNIVLIVQVGETWIAPFIFKQASKLFKRESLLQIE